MEPAAAQELAKLFGPYHNILYYCPEIRSFADRGIPGWWRAYFAYRAAPLGPVPLEVVVSVFYNFSPRMVARSIPESWSIMAPEEILALRNEVVDTALRRVLGDAVHRPDMAEAAALARSAIEGCDVGCRPLFAGLSGLAWPTEPHLQLWHACTLMREHRGDCHNIALAAAHVDGLESHLLMVAHGHGNKASILPIRGWTSEEWDAAEARLVQRGWLEPGGTFTEEGRKARHDIETATSRLALEPCRRLGPDGLARLAELMGPAIQALHSRGDVPGSWPPPHLLRS